MEKAENLLASYVESIAKHRDRNVEWVVDAVRNSVAVGADEALEIGVIDVIAPDREALLENAGNAPLLVHDLSVVGKAFYLDDHPDLPLQLGPGETAPVQLTFDPLVLGWQTDQGTVRWLGLGLR